MPETLPDTPERCTCGTVLVENARFCHRCGRPTHELTPAEEQEFAPPPAPQPSAVPPPPPPPLPISFANPIAMRVAFLMSLGIMMTSLLAQVIPAGGILFLMWWPLAGWTAVRLYRRITGLRLSVASGARLGFLTGLLSSLIIAVSVCLGFLTPSGHDQLDQMMTQMKQDPRVASMLSDQVAVNTFLFAGVVFALVVIFVVVTGVCAASGALGAKFGAPPAPRVEPRA